MVPLECLVVDEMVIERFRLMLYDVPLGSRTTYYGHQRARMCGRSMPNTPQCTIGRQGFPVYEKAVCSGLQAQHIHAGFGTLDYLMG